MPVIGRLDEQVDDVLIKPLARKGEQEMETVAPQENIARSQATTQAAKETNSSGLQPAEREELPVWLL
jgi:hypothetical protein